MFDKIIYFISHTYLKRNIFKNYLKILKTFIEKTEYYSEGKE